MDERIGVSVLLCDACRANWLSCFVRLHLSCYTCPAQDTVQMMSMERRQAAATQIIARSGHHSTRRRQLPTAPWRGSAIAWHRRVEQPPDCMWQLRKQALAASLALVTPPTQPEVAPQEKTLPCIMLMFFDGPKCMHVSTQCLWDGTLHMARGACRDTYTVAE